MTILRPAARPAHSDDCHHRHRIPAGRHRCGKGPLPGQAAGSLIVKDGKPVGSRLIGQPFSDPKYFWSRPSATSPQPDNGLSSGGSNLGPLNPALTDAVKARIAALQAADPTNHAPIPVDLVTASGSGLDPDISLAAAYYQADRIARLQGPEPGPGPRSDRRPCQGALARSARRAPGQRAGAEPRARYHEIIERDEPTVEARPDPDQLLAHVKAEEARARAAGCGSFSAPPPASARPTPCWRRLALRRRRVPTS